MPPETPGTPGERYKHPPRQTRTTRQWTWHNSSDGGSNATSCGLRPSTESPAPTREPKRVNAVAEPECDSGRGRPRYYRERARAAPQPMDTDDPGGREARKRTLPHGRYSDTRTNRPRTNPDEMSRRRTQARQSRLGTTANSTEIGKRLRDEMYGIANECERQRRQDRFGDG